MSHWSHFPALVECICSLCAVAASWSCWCGFRKTLIQQIWCQCQSSMEQQCTPGHSTGWIELDSPKMSLFHQKKSIHWSQPACTLVQLDLTLDPLYTLLDACKELYYWETIKRGYICGILILQFPTIIAIACRQPQTAHEHDNMLPCSYVCPFIKHFLRKLLSVRCFQMQGQLEYLCLLMLCHQLVATPCSPHLQWFWDEWKGGSLCLKLHTVHTSEIDTHIHMTNHHSGLHHCCLHSHS